jgi:hypothetical protein
MSWRELFNIRDSAIDEVLMALPPRSDEELLAGSDLAGYARVVSRKNGYVTLRFSKFLKGKPRGPGIFARLGLSRTAVVSVYLGTARVEGDGHLIARHLVMETIGDEASYVPGSQVKTHLWWNAQQQVYETLCNAVSRVK